MTGTPVGPVCALDIDGVLIDLHGRPYPGVAARVARLAAAFRLVVVTTRPDRDARAALDDVGLAAPVLEWRDSKLDAIGRLTGPVALVDDDPDDRVRAFFGASPSGLLIVCDPAFGLTGAEVRALERWADAARSR